MTSLSLSTRRISEQSGGRLIGAESEQAPADATSDHCRATTAAFSRTCTRRRPETVLPPPAPQRVDLDGEREEVGAGGAGPIFHSRNSAADRLRRAYLAAAAAADADTLAIFDTRLQALSRTLRSDRARVDRPSDRPRISASCRGYNYDSTSIRRAFDCLAKVIGCTVA